MSDDEQLSILLQGADTWNRWRDENPGISIDLTGLNGSTLRDINLCKVNFEESDLSGANFQKLDLRGVRLARAVLNGANLNDANLSGVDLRGIKLCFAELNRANLKDSNLAGSILTEAKLKNAILV